MLERIQKIISAAGVTSRRAAEQLIAEGRVRVNGKVVTEPGTKADAAKDHIKVDGKLINPKQPPTYLMLNKPPGFVTTMSDPEGRPTVQDLLKGVKTRVYPIGRLDYNTEGLLLLTNDGDFAHLITHPRHEFPKTYLAKVKGLLDDRQIELLENGMFLADGKTAPAKVKKIRKEEANSWVEITIHEGRKRQVRRMFDHVGRSVIKLKRNRIGVLPLGDLPEGSYRHLTSEEVKALKENALRTGESLPAGTMRTKHPPQPTKAGASRPGPAKQTETRVETRGKKKAHKGRMPDLRPWRREDKRDKDMAGPTSRPGSPFKRGNKPFRPKSGSAGRSTTGTTAAGMRARSDWRSGTRGTGKSFRSDRTASAGRREPARRTERSARGRGPGAGRRGPRR